MVERHFLQILQHPTHLHWTNYSNKQKSRVLSVSRTKPKKTYSRKPKNEGVLVGESLVSRAERISAWQRELRSKPCRSTGGGWRSRFALVLVAHRMYQKCYLFSTYTVQSSASKENCVCWGGFSGPSWGRLNLHLNGYNQMTLHLSPFRCQLSWLVCLQICCVWWLCSVMMMVTGGGGGNDERRKRATCRGGNLPICFVLW